MKTLLIILLFPVLSFAQISDSTYVQHIISQDRQFVTTLEIHSVTIRLSDLRTSIGDSIQSLEDAKINAFSFYLRQAVQYDETIATLRRDSLDISK